MEQVTPYSYKVKQGETVTFEVTPIGTGPTVTASQSPGGIEQIGDPTRPKFQFEITQPAKKLHVAKLEFSFLQGSSDDARFEIQVKGSKNGQVYKIPAVTKDSPVKDPDFSFTVVALTNRPE